MRGSRHRWWQPAALPTGRGVLRRHSCWAPGALIGRAFLRPEALARTGRNSALLLPAACERRAHARVRHRTLRSRERTGRALRNRFMERWDGRERDLAGALETERAAYQVAVREGDFDAALVWAGEVVDLIKSVEGAAALVAQISADAETQLRTGAKLVR